MDRPTVYSGEVPRTVDILQGEQNTMVALAKLVEATVGTAGYVAGLACTPGAGLTVSVAAGQIYQLAGLEATTWSALGADTSDQIVKQGIALAAQTISLTPPATGGFSQVFMIEAQYADLDTGSTVLPYYNAANPAAPFSGPGNTGTPQNTARKGTVLLQVKAGIAATTGTQVAPTVDSGFIALWLVTLANGAVTISSGNIVQVANAPFMGAAYMPQLPTIPTYVQSGAWGYCVDTGAANAITVAPSPPPLSIVAGTKLTIKLLNAVTGATTCAVKLLNGTTSTSPVVHGDLTALLANDLVASQVVELNFDGSNWQMPRASASVAANQMTSSSVGLNAPINCAISAAIGAGALTVSVLGANGSALSTSNPLVATFRSATIGSGLPVTRIITSIPAFTVNSGNTLGVLNNAGGATNVFPRLRVVLIDNAGTVLVGLQNCLNQAAGVVQILPLSETTLNSTGAGTGGGSTAGVIYTTVASLSGLAIREIGFLEWTAALGTSGTYTNLPNEIQLAGPGYKRAGDIVQTITTNTTTPGTVTNTAFTALATSPSGTITPTSAANPLRVFTAGTLNIAGGVSSVFLQFQRGSTLVGNPVSMTNEASGNPLAVPTSILLYDSPGVVTATTYSFQGKSSASALSYPFASTGAIVELQEIAA